VDRDRHGERHPTRGRQGHRVADDASLSVRRLDRTTRDLDPAVRSLRRAADALSQARTAP
jgi:hypothetical protein